MTSEYNLALNFNNHIPVKTDMTFKQGDKGITLNLSTTGLTTTGTEAHIVFKRSNGTSVEAELTGQSGPNYTYTILGNEFEIPGVVVADLKLYDGDTQRVSTASFIFQVTGDTLDGIGGGTGGYSDQLEQMSQEFEDTLEDYIDAFGNTAPINPCGDYNSGTTYYPRDMVYDSNTGTSWVCKQESTGNAPTDGSAYWQKLVNSSGSANFGDLTDVSLTSPSDGQVPTYNGTSHEWENKSIPAGSFAGLSDVSVSGVTDGQIPKYNGTSSKWEAVTPPSIPAKTSDLSDVASTAPTNGQILKYNGTSQKYEPANESGGGGGSNPNLFINPWFTVNQRGFTTGSTSGNYGVDRWKNQFGSVSGSTVTLGSSGLTCTPAAGGYSAIQQAFESFDNLQGKTLTVSILLSDGTIKHGTVNNFDKTSDVDLYYNNAEGIQVHYYNSLGAIRVSFTQTYTLRAVKLEIGSTSTLHLDTAPDYTTELLKCQRYYMVIPVAGASNYPIPVVGYGISTTQVRVALPLSVPLRKKDPSVTYSGVIILVADGSNFTVTSIASVQDGAGNMQPITLAVSSGITSFRVYSVLLGNNGKIMIDAEL